MCKWGVRRQGGIGARETVLIGKLRITPTRRATSLIVALALAICLVISAAATTHGAADCQFVLGFKTLRNLIGHDLVGVCLENEHHNTTGDSVQHTTGGLLVWRKADNWTAFTDGYRTWINGPNGLEQRLNTERFPWELDFETFAKPTPTPMVTETVIALTLPTDRPWRPDDPPTVETPMSGRDFLAFYQSFSNAELIRSYLKELGLDQDSIWASVIVRSYTPLLSFARWTAEKHIERGGTIPDMWWFLYAHYHTRDFSGVRHAVWPKLTRTERLEWIEREICSSRPELRTKEECNQWHGTE